jgi:hypothetical protein
MVASTVAGDIEAQLVAQLPVERLGDASSTDFRRAGLVLEPLPDDLVLGLHLRHGRQVEFAVGQTLARSSGVGRP